MMEKLNLPTTSSDPKVTMNELSPHLLEVETAFVFEVTFNELCIAIQDSNNHPQLYAGICIGTITT